MKYKIEGRVDVGKATPRKFQIYIEADNREEAERKFWNGFSPEIVDKPRQKYTIESINKVGGRMSITEDLL